MPSMQQQIVARMQAVLAGALPAGVAVFRDRTVPITRDDTPCINLRRTRETKERATLAADFATFTVAVCVHVRGEPWPDVADPIAVQAHAALCADQQLARLVASVRNSGSEWDDHDADEGAGCLTLDYDIRYAVRAADITNSNIL